MYAIAEITRNDNGKIIGKTHSASFMIERDDLNGAWLGDTVIIKYHPQDQFAIAIPLNKITSIEFDKE
jgi:hypothetical protein